MYFEFFELKSWGKRSANNRRRFNQWLLKTKMVVWEIITTVPVVCTGPLRAFYQPSL